jgi:hypothetical protein
MLKKDLIILINSLKDDEHVEDALKGSELVNKFSGLETFKSKMNDGEFKSFMDSEKDKHLTKGLETFKTNNLAALVDAEVKKKYPTKDPNEIAMENMKVELEKMKTESARKDLKTNAMKILSDKKLPTDLVDYFLGADETSTNDNLAKFETILNASVTSLVAEKLKGGYTPPGDKGGVDPNSMGMKLALQAQEAQKTASTVKNYFD